MYSKNIEPNIPYKKKAIEIIQFFVQYLFNSTLIIINWVRYFFISGFRMKAKNIAPPELYFICLFVL